MQPSPKKTSAMSRELVKVRIIRPHDTTEGLQAPGDEYERSKTDADQLAKQGVVEVVSARAARSK
jgi:hypothetical protein